MAELSTARDSQLLSMTGLERCCSSLSNASADWKGRSCNFVKTRTPTQIARHAQKYFLRHSNLNRRRRSSLFDITTDTVAAFSMEEEQAHRIYRLIINLFSFCY
ncbi:hypothetical protein RCOM_1620860 [Ricinus communis]|uniref:HTH myb-type domain-containing protein n=1 Tax=Ricinus communis TaxID=3988 RepID=B9REE3_RICCO|nr:hypothetical protein RCOM_1620860 [Ricinus communis]